MIAMVIFMESTKYKRNSKLFFFFSYQLLREVNRISGKIMFLDFQLEFKIINH